MIVYDIYDKCCKKKWSLSAHLLMRFHDNARSTWLTFFEKSIGAILTKNRMKLWWKWIISDAPPNQITADHVSVYYVMQRKGSFSYKQFGLLDSCWWDKQSTRRRRRRLSTSRYCLGRKLPQSISREPGGFLTVFEVSGKSGNFLSVSYILKIWKCAHERRKGRVRLAPL